MVTRIEKELLICNEDKFANICRLYLAYRYPIVHSSGFALGKEKSKAGVPDNFIAYKGFYIFNEITTQEKGLKAKLKKDIADCFKQNDIENEKIAKIILICNSKINPKLDKELREYKNTLDFSSELEVIGIDALANIMVNQYPSLCNELGVPIDTGQILEVDNFVDQIEESKFSTPLRNKFFNREDDVKTAIDILTNQNILLISGQAGVGKTKLSLKVVEKFRELNENFQVKYIISNGNLDIWDDLNTQILKDKSYLIVVDDANKLKSNLSLIAKFIKNRKSLKLILTVRNYVKTEVEGYLESYGLIELKEFTRDELSLILRSPDFNISEYYIDKIYSISKGNPRIAIMAAIAGLKNELDKLNNASQIHEQYFTAINDSIKTLNDSELLKVAGILSIFKIIDTKDLEKLEEIEKYFAINKDNLTSKLKMLYSFEVADEMQGVYKVADQILGEFIFYKIFLKEKELPFEILLNAYVDKRKFNLLGILTPIINNYGFNTVKDLIEFDIKIKWEEIKEDNYKAMRYLEDFWYYLTSETLIYVSNRVKNIEKVSLQELKFVINNENHIEQYDDEIIKLLIKFREIPEKFDFALQLLFCYGLSSQLLFSNLLKALKQSFAYGQYSYETKYGTQIKLFDFLYSKVEEDEIFYSKIILHTADKFLIDSYNSTVNYGNALQIVPKVVEATSEQIDFRKKLWRFICECYQVKDLKESVLDFFLSHHYSYYFNNEKIIEIDNNFIIPFFETNFSNSHFRESMVIDMYEKRIRRFDIKHPEDFKNKYLCKEFKTWLLLNERGENNKQLIIKTFKDYKESDYLDLLNEIEIIAKYKPNFFNGWSTILDSISTIFEDLAKTDFKVFISIIEDIVKRDISNIIRIEKAFQFIDYSQENLKILRKVIIENEDNHYYLLSLILNMPSDSIQKSDYDLSIGVLNKEIARNIAFIEDLLPKVSHLNLNIEHELDKIFKILLRKTEQEGFLYVHTDLFKYVSENHPYSFERNIEIIKSIYLNLDKKGRYFDYDLGVLKLILGCDNTFITELLHSNFDEKTRISKRDLSENDFSKLWVLDDYYVIFKQILTYFSTHPMMFAYTPCDVSNLFKGNSEKEIKFLKSILKEATIDSLIRKIYNIVVTKYNDIKLTFLKSILYKNRDLEFFKQLDFYVLSLTYNGDEIPRIHHKMNAYVEAKNFILTLNNIDYLEHISVLEKAITNCKVSIENAKKRDFIDRWDL